MNSTYIIAFFLVLWLLIFVGFMIVYSNRKKKAVSFVSDNSVQKLKLMDGILLTLIQ